MIYSDRIRKSLERKILMDLSRVEIGLRKSIFNFIASTKINSKAQSDIDSYIVKYIEKINHFKLTKKDNILIDQSTIDSKSIRNRLNILDDLIVSGDKVLFIGDNDLVSIILSYDERINHITIVDIDDQVLEFIKLNANSSKIELIKDDFRNYIDRVRIPYYGKFQIVQSDPPYTEAGYRLYNYIANCNIEIGGVFLLVVPDMEYENWNYELKGDIQKCLSNGGFIIENIIKRNQTFIEEYGIISSTWILLKVMTGDIPKVRNKNKLYTIK